MVFYQNFYTEDLFQLLSIKKQNLLKDTFFNMFLKKFLSVGLLIVICTVITRCNQNNSEHLKLVKKIANWLDSAAIEMTHGKTWPVDPKDPSTATSNLYSGSAGAVLF